MFTSDPDTLRAIVARVLRIEDVTIGNGKEFLMRYRGHLYDEDSAKAYDQLAEALRPYEITPLFRIENDQHAVLLTRGVIRPAPSNPVVNLVMFSLTVLTVFLAGTYYTLGGIYQGPSNPTFQELLPSIRLSLGGGLAFTVSLLAILVSHEFGHYLAGRYHHTSVTLPYFPRLRRMW